MRKSQEIMNLCNQPSCPPTLPESGKPPAMESKPLALQIGTLKPRTRTALLGIRALEEPELEPRSPTPNPVSSAEGGQDYTGKPEAMHSSLDLGMEARNS